MARRSIGPSYTNLKELRDWHREAIRMLISGVRVNDVARKLDRSYDAVSGARWSEPGKAYAAELLRKREDTLLTSAILGQIGHYRERPAKATRRKRGVVASSDSDHPAGTHEDGSVTE